MNNRKPLVIALLGPTASGKTNLAIEIAQKLNLDIHNIDSRQIYVDMDIGTAKPTKEQQKKVPHFLIDLCLPNQRISLHEFQNQATLSVKKSLKKSRVVLLVGGSGLYMKSITEGLSPPAVPAQVLLREELNKLKKIECHQLLEHCDPLAAEKIHPQDSVRTIRALEVFYSTGQPISLQQSIQRPPWDILEIGLNPENLRERISQRTKEIYEMGLLDETKQLICKYGWDLELLNTIGYEEAKSIIKGQLFHEEAITITTKRTCQFAKRQKTWFRNKHNPKWLNDEEPLQEALSLIEEALL